MVRPQFLLLPVWCGLSPCSCLCGAASVLAPACVVRPQSLTLLCGAASVLVSAVCDSLRAAVLLAHYCVKRLCVNWGKADLFTVTAMFLCGCSGWLLSFFVATYSFLWLHLDWNICVIAGWIPWPHFCWVLAVIIFTKGCRDSSIAAIFLPLPAATFQLLGVEPWSSLLWQKGYTQSS